MNETGNDYTKKVYVKKKRKSDLENSEIDNATVSWLVARRGSLDRNHIIFFLQHE